MQWAWHRGAFESRLCRFLLVSCCSQPREVIHRRLKPMVEGQLTRCQPHVPVYHNAHFWASKGSLPSVVLFFRLLARLVRPNIPQFRSQTSVTQQPTRSIPTRPYSAQASQANGRRSVDSMSAACTSVPQRSLLGFKRLVALRRSILSSSGSSCSPQYPSISLTNLGHTTTHQVHPYPSLLRTTKAQVLDFIRDDPHHAIPYHHIPLPRCLCNLSHLVK